MHRQTLNTFSREEVIVLAALQKAEDIGHAGLLLDYAEWIDRLTRVGISARPVLMLLSGQTLIEIDAALGRRKGSAHGLISEALSFHPALQALKKGAA